LMLLHDPLLWLLQPLLLVQPPVLVCQVPRLILSVVKSRSRFKKNVCLKCYVCCLKCLNLHFRGWSATFTLSTHFCRWCTSFGYIILYNYQFWWLKSTF
jgi:hypothetical protein